jgi:hypothetical protein
MTATTPLTCDGFANALADYLERDDTPRVRGAVETHAASCAACGALMADLHQLRIDASGLPTLTPSRDLWAGVAERIATPVVELDRVRGAGAVRGAAAVRGAGRPSRVWLRPAAAAAALVIITAGVTYFATREALLSDPQIAAQPVDSAAADPHKMVADAIDSANRAERVAASRPDARSNGRALGGYRPQADGSDRGPAGTDGPPALANRTPAILASRQVPVAAALETVYGQEISRLRTIIDERRALLDTATVGVIERNLTIIDQAIRESRAALGRDPASALLNEQLNYALEQKVELLRAAALLPIRT